MPRLDAAAFEHTDRQALYRLIAEEGRVDADRAASHLGLDRTAIEHHVAILKRDGRITVEDGQLELAVDAGAEEDRVTPEGTPYTIRPARQNDLGGIVAAITAVVEAGPYVEAESVAHVIDHEDVVLRFDAVASRMFFVATIQDDVVGWVTIEGSELEKLVHTAELTLGVIEPYRNEGIGTHLLRRAVEWASQHGYERLYQSVPATNDRAIGFLEHHGWTVEAVRSDHYRIDGDYVDEIMLAVQLN